jgi:alkylhydroperoxidase/carboxymuconolactone decarboxylase family protein YurZ
MMSSIGMFRRLPLRLSRRPPAARRSMGGSQRSTPERSLRALAAGDASVLETLAQMQLETLERSALDEQTYVLVRLAALVATDAAPVSYRAHRGVADDLGISMDKVLGTFVAIAPIVGSGRVLSAASRMDRAGLIAADEDEPRQTASSTAS